MNNLNLIYTLPEITLIITAILNLIINIFFINKKNKITYYLSIISLLICSIFTINNLLKNKIIYTFNNMFINDKLSNFSKLFIYLINFAIIIYTQQYFTYKKLKKKLFFIKEFYFFILFNIIGQIITISTNNLLIIFLGLELTSLSICSLLISNKKIKSIEASIKYFILNVLASGVLLYGISIIYGSTNSIELNKILKIIKLGKFHHNTLILGIIFLLINLIYKFGIAPFHIWISDIYEGAICPVTMLISCTPKITIFIVLLRVIYNLYPIMFYFKKILIFLSIFSIIIGNLSAIMQKNTKRMLGYSSIFHTGLILLGITTSIINKKQFINSFSYTLFYIIIYIITNIGILSITMILSNHKSESQNIKNFNGLNKKNSLFAIISLFFLFSLSGIPPFIGFYTKFSILKLLIITKQKYIAIIVNIFSLISIFYLLIIIKNIFFKKPFLNLKSKNKFLIKTLLLFNTLIIIFISIYPNFLINICHNIINKTFLKI